jgi:carboxylesterase type B
MTKQFTISKKAFAKELGIKPASLAVDLSRVSTGQSKKFPKPVKAKDFTKVGQSNMYTRDYVERVKKALVKSGKTRSIGKTVILKSKPAKTAKKSRQSVSIVSTQRKPNSDSVSIIMTELTNYKTLKNALSDFFKATKHLLD